MRWRQAWHGLGRCAGVRRHGGAKGATLTFMCGGDDKAFARGKAGAGKDGQEDRALRRRRRGQAAKICNNMMLRYSMIAVGEAFALAEKLGLSHQALFDVVSTSSGQCWALTTYCPVPGRCRPRPPTMTTSRVCPR
jgi:3-hydroxyisobutyrate dehydrogenase